jgi:hypothetical protein
MALCIFTLGTLLQECHTAPPKPNYILEEQTYNSSPSLISYRVTPFSTGAPFILGVLVPLLELPANHAAASKFPRGFAPCDPESGDDF